MTLICNSEGTLPKTVAKNVTVELGRKLHRKGLSVRTKTDLATTSATSPGGVPTVCELGHLKKLGQSPFPHEEGKKRKNVGGYL